MSTHDDEFYGRPELVQQRARALILARLAWMAIALFILVSLAILVFNAIQSISTRQTLIDCTTPSGKCYQQSQKQTAVVIKQLIHASQADGDYTRHIVVVATACADEDVIHNQPNARIRQAMIQRCVDDQLQKEKQKQ